MKKNWLSGREITPTKGKQMGMPEIIGGQVGGRKGTDLHGSNAWAGSVFCPKGENNDKAKTEETMTPDGWLKTGDVGMMSAETKSISIIDRKKNIFKLQQGEYVAAEKVENIYLKGPLLAEIFIHGDSTETFVIGIVVPHKKALEELVSVCGGDISENFGGVANFRKAPPPFSPDVLGRFSD